MNACSVYMMARCSVPAFTAFKSTFQSVGHLVTDYIKTYIKWELTFFFAHAYKNIVDLSKLIIFHKEAICFSILQIIFFKSNNHHYLFYNASIVYLFWRFDFSILLNKLCLKKFIFFKKFTNNIYAEKRTVFTALILIPWKATKTVSCVDVTSFLLTVSWAL